MSPPFGYIHFDPSTFDHDPRLILWFCVDMWSSFDPSTIDLDSALILRFQVEMSRKIGLTFTLVDSMILSWNVEESWRYFICIDFEISSWNVKVNWFDLDPSWFYDFKWKLKVLHGNLPTVDLDSGAFLQWIGM